MQSTPKNRTTSFISTRTEYDQEEHPPQYWEKQSRLLRQIHAVCQQKQEISFAWIQENSPVLRNCLTAYEKRWRTTKNNICQAFENITLNNAERMELFDPQKKHVLINRKSGRGGSKKNLNIFLIDVYNSFQMFNQEQKIAINLGLSQAGGLNSFLKNYFNQAQFADCQKIIQQCSYEDFYEHFINKRIKQIADDIQQEKPEQQNRMQSVQQNWEEQSQVLKRIYDLCQDDQIDFKYILDHHDLLKCLTIYAGKWRTNGENIFQAFKIITPANAEKWKLFNPGQNNILFYRKRLSKMTQYIFLNQIYDAIKNYKGIQLAKQIGYNRQKYLRSFIQRYFNSAQLTDCQKIIKKHSYEDFYEMFIRKSIKQTADSILDDDIQTENKTTSNNPRSLLEKRRNKKNTPAQQDWLNHDPVQHTNILNEEKKDEVSELIMRAEEDKYEVLNSAMRQEERHVSLNQFDIFFRKNNFFNNVPLDIGYNQDMRGEEQGFFEESKINVLHAFNFFESNSPNVIGNNISSEISQDAADENKDAVSELAMAQEINCNQGVRNKEPYLTEEDKIKMLNSLFK